MHDAAGPSLDRLRPRVVLTLRGDLDVAAAADVQKRLLELELVPGAQLVLDLRDVPFMDSTGVRLILVARELAEQRRAGFALVRGPESVMSVLELVGLDGQLDIVDRI